MIPRDSKDVSEKVISLLPDEEDATADSVEASTPLHEALRLMRQERREYLLVHQDRVLLGVLCYRSIAQGLRNLAERDRKSFDNLSVDAFLEEPSRVHHSDSVDGIVEKLEQKGYLVVGHDWPLGIVTAAKAMRYFERQAAAYIFLKEIELSIRYLVSQSASLEEIQEIATVCLAKKYRPTGPPPAEKSTEERRSLPQSLDEFDFSDYITIITSGMGWTVFGPAFGLTAAMAATKLKPINKIRNDVFHFKRELTGDDVEELVAERDRLMRRVDLMEKRKRSGGDQ